MINVEVSIVINRPVADVFAFVANFENHPKWETNFLEVKRASPDPIGAGTIYECALKLPGQRAQSRFEITEYELNRKIAFRADQPAQARPAGSMTFESVAGGTKLTVLPRPEMGGLFKLLEPLMAGYIKQNNVDHLRQLKALLEAQ